MQKSKFGKAGKYPIIDQSQNEIAGWTDDNTAVICINRPVVIFGDHTCSIKYSDKPFVQGADGIKILETRETLMARFLFFYLLVNPIQSDGYKRHFSKLVETQIFLPPLNIQRQIVAELEAERKLVEANRELIARMEAKIKAKLAEVWGEETKNVG